MAPGTRLRSVYCSPFIPETLGSAWSPKPPVANPLSPAMLLRTHGGYDQDHRVHLRELRALSMARMASGVLACPPRLCFYCAHAGDLQSVWEEVIHQGAMPKGSSHLWSLIPWIGDSGSEHSGDASRQQCVDC